MHANCWPNLKIVQHVDNCHISAPNQAHVGQACTRPERVGFWIDSRRNLGYIFSFCDTPKEWSTVLLTCWYSSKTIVSPWRRLASINTGCSASCHTIYSGVAQAGLVVCPSWKGCKERVSELRSKTRVSDARGKLAKKRRSALKN